MKRHIIITLAALAALTSCVSMTRVAQDTSSRYQDGIYYALSTSNPVTEVSDTETQALINKTRGSQIFLKNEDKLDTLFIPENMSATLQFNDNNKLSSITLNERSNWNTYWGYSYLGSPFYPYYSSILYNPYSLRSRIYYRDMVWTFGWDPFYYPWFDPFYWDIYYSPYYYSSLYYSPFYYDYWYSPFYYGYYPYYYPSYYGLGYYHHGGPGYFAGPGPHGGGPGFHGAPGHNVALGDRTFIGRAPKASVSTAGGVRRETSPSTKSAPANGGSSTVRRLPAGSSATTRVAGTSSRPAGTASSGNVQTRSSASASSGSTRATNGSAANTTYRRAVPSSSRSTAGSSSSGSVSRSSGSAPRSSGSVSRSSGSVSRSSGSVSRSSGSSGGYSGGGRSSGGGGGYSGGGSSGGGGGRSGGGSSGGGGGRGR